MGSAIELSARAGAAAIPTGAPRSAIYGRDPAKRRPNSNSNIPRAYPDAFHCPIANIVSNVDPNCHTIRNRYTDRDANSVLDSNSSTNSSY